MPVRSPRFLRRSSSYCFFVLPCSAAACGVSLVRSRLASRSSRRFWSRPGFGFFVSAITHLQGDVNVDDPTPATHVSLTVRLQAGVLLVPQSAGEGAASDA